MEKVDGLAKGGQTTTMDRWEKAISENKNKNEERQGIMDRGQRAAKMEPGNKVANEECKTCASRRYVDQSDDASVSFQSPTHVGPDQSFAAVMGHEHEHVANEKAKAENNNREVVQSSVTIHYAMCPECGKRYAAGGETRTVTKSKPKEDGDKEWLPMDMRYRRGEQLNGRIVDSKA